MTAPRTEQRGLAPTEPPVSTALAQPLDDPWAQYGADEVEGVSPIFPEIRVIQKAIETIPESGRHNGDFWLSDDGIFAPTLDGTFIMATGTRTLFDAGELGVILCASDDARFPRPNQQVWQLDTVTTKDGERVEVPVSSPRSCAECPLAGNPCRYSFLALFENEDGKLYRMRWKGTAVKEMRRFLGTMAGVGARRASGRIGRPIFSKRVHLYTEQRNENSFTWFVPRIEVTDNTPGDLAPEYVAFAAGLRGQFAETVAATHDDVPADEAVPVDDGWVEA